MTNVLVAEFHKTFGRKVAWVITGAVTVFTVLYFVLATMTARQAQVTGMDVGSIPPVSWPHGLVTGVVELLSPGFVGGIAAIVLVSSLWSSEMRWRTLHLWLGRGVSRTQMLVAKVVILVLPLLLVGGVGTVAAGGTSAALTLLAEGRISLQQVDGPQLVLGMLRSTLALMPVAALTLLVGVVVPSGVGSLGGALGYLLLGEQLLGTVLGLVGVGEMARYLPIAVANNLVDHGRSMVHDAAGPLMVMDAATALVACMAWTAILLGVAIWSLRRRDLTG